MDRRRIVLAATGASGAIYFRMLAGKLSALPTDGLTVAAVMSDNAREVWRTELGDDGYEHLPFRIYGKSDFGAPFASGSGRFDTMIVAPCSMGTLGRIAGGISNDLITRAADVMLKERRRLILVLREAPYNLLHIRNMEAATLAGAIICPATPSFYSRPTTLEDAVATVVDRVLDLAGIDVKTYRWGGQH
jgi:4-hydroxy-3-polyprenylbenzoate decarboxylase